MTEKPVRILHIVHTMGRAGLETWLMHVLRRIDRDRFRMDFMVQGESKGDYDAEIRSLGSKVIPCAPRRRPPAHFRDFRRILGEEGPYDVVHSHFHHYNGFALRLANEAGVPIRIAHSHNDYSPYDASRSRLRQAGFRLMRRWIFRYATAGLAASQEAARSLFGEQWQKDPRLRLLYYGIDMAPFHEPVDSSSLRAELGIPEGAFVVGHVGRFTEQKNHRFLVEIVAEMARRNPDFHVLLVSDGPLRPEIERRIAQKGLTGKVTFAGVRSDIPRLMKGAMDSFLLPSFYEGLPLVGIEAQAAGLPFVVSDIVSPEMDVAHPLIRRLSLSQPASEWAETVLATRGEASPESRAEALRPVENSPLNIETSVREVEKAYGG